MSDSDSDSNSGMKSCKFCQKNDITNEDYRCDACNCYVCSVCAKDDKFLCEALVTEGQGLCEKCIDDGHVNHAVFFADWMKLRRRIQ